MKRTLLFLLCITYTFCVCGQSDYTYFTHTIQAFYQAPKSADYKVVDRKTDSLWMYLQQQNQIPFRWLDSVAFLYRGDANTISWVGDFNKWGYDQTFPGKGTRIPNTTIWIWRTRFPTDARLDYKILVNEKNWLIDPANPFQQWSGVGGGSPNSELRMPEWKPDPITEITKGIASGKLDKDLLFDSKILGYQITYSIYYPAGYSTDNSSPILYVTDGYEYLHERMGNMSVILDNLIASYKIQPPVVIFIDHREPVNRSNNRRMQELAMNSLYLNFLNDEFIPAIEQHMNVSIDPSLRGILGTSMGGLAAAYFAFSKPSLFGLVGIQSPAFWFKPEIYALCEKAESQPIKVVMTSGTINDAQEGSLKMKAILEKNTCTYEYIEISQGHSWGNFRDLIDDILISFFPPR
jgi:enterochelin esterase-like enzyme